MDSADLMFEDPQPSAYDTLPYDDPPQPLDTPETIALASRIGSKLYPFPETSQPKRKHQDEERDDTIQEDTEDVINTDSDIRANAIYLTGTPISSLPTARIFAYCKHFRAQPIGLEWVDDTSCVLVFDSTTAAQTAFTSLQKSVDADGEVIAHPVPVVCWPPEERVGQTLGVGERMKEPLTMRRATRFDVKRKGAKEESQFYKKYGENAGKETYEESRERPVKRHRRSSMNDEEKKKALDQELDSFLAQDEEELAIEETVEEEPSKMRSDYIASDGRTVLDPPDQTPVVELAARLSNPRRKEHGGRGRRRESNTRNVRPKKTTAELDAELEAFLNERG